MIIIGPTYTKEYADREMAAITRAGDRILASKELREKFLASLGLLKPARKKTARTKRNAATQRRAASVGKRKTDA